MNHRSTSQAQLLKKELEARGLTVLDEFFVGHRVARHHYEKADLAARL